ncbi:MAG: arginine-ornithine antiporter [Bacteroidetes bacterium]|jgi:arginine:ornithine antiporter/lysine permease|nr:arginine-ornithine antiporter [Bacteroidota bacterium]|tara:strand:+ start:313 stop:1800 length:1488 start_codon:yes stop_codon:yes gene_type:complete
MPEHTKKVGFLGLAAIVVGSMLGGGVFNLPSNMSEGAALGAVLIAWIITGIGMFFLAQTFKILSDTRPDLSSGIYTYAAEGFGKYIGFNSAWGYWLSAAIGNVSFAVLMMQALGYFFPVFLSGNNWQSILGGSILIWSMNIIVRRGVNGAAILNVVSTIAKLVPLFIFVIVLLFVFNWDKLTFDIWGNLDDNLGSLPKQIKSTMLVTLWAFVGIEGAVVISGRAKNKKDVGKATFIGFLGAIIIYAAISIFSFGIMNQADLAKLPDPSTAYVMKAIVGNWGAIVLNLGVIISILGAWLAWTIITSEVPSTAALHGVLPKALGRYNKNESPFVALTVTSIIMQITLLFSAFEKNAFLAIISIAGSMILIPYVLSAMFLFKQARSKDGAKHLSGTLKTQAIITGAMATMYGFWLVYAAGLKYILLSSILYAIGILVYKKAWKENKSNEPLFKPYEKIIAVIIVILAVGSLGMMLSGFLRVDNWVHWFKHHVLDTTQL